jgi:hypothetical protein
LVLPSFDSRGARGWRGPQNLWARRDTLCFDEKRVVRLREHTWRAFAWFARGSARGPSKTREEEPSEPRKHGFVGRKINVAFLLALVAIAGPPGGAKKAEQINDHDSTFSPRRRCSAGLEGGRGRAQNQKSWPHIMGPTPRTIFRNWSRTWSHDMGPLFRIFSQQRAAARGASEGRQQRPQKVLS